MVASRDNAGQGLIVVHARYPLSEQYNLAAETAEMLSALARRRPTMHFSLAELPHVRLPAPEGVEVVELPLAVDRGSQRDILMKSLYLYFRLPRTAAELRRRSPALIYLSEALPMYGYLLKKLTGTRVAITFGDRHFHNRFGETWWSWPLLRAIEFFERFEVVRVDGVFTRGRHCGDVPRQHGVPAERLRNVYDVPHGDAYAPRDRTDLRAKAGFTADDVVLSYHGVMHHGKALDMLLTWVAELHREDPRFGIILIGSGPEETNLRQLAARLGIGRRAYFTGWLPTLRDVGDYCNASDIAVAMRRGTDSNRFAISGALIHSLACGKITVAPRMPGMAEIIRDGDNGFLFAPDDGEDFKRLMRDLASRRSEWPALQERALQDVRDHYSITAAARAYADALEHFASLPPKGKQTVESGT